MTEVAKENQEEKGSYDIGCERKEEEQEEALEEEVVLEEEVTTEGRNETREGVTE